MHFRRWERQQILILYGYHGVLCSPAEHEQVLNFVISNVIIQVLQLHITPWCLSAAPSTPWSNLSFSSIFLSNIFVCFPNILILVTKFFPIKLLTNSTTISWAFKFKKPKIFGYKNNILFLLVEWIALENMHWEKCHCCPTSTDSSQSGRTPANSANLEELLRFLPVILALLTIHGHAFNHEQSTTPQIRSVWAVTPLRFLPYIRFWPNLKAIVGKKKKGTIF